MKERFLKYIAIFIALSAGFGAYNAYSTEVFTVWVLAFSGWTLVAFAKEI
jgi:hypothetical protein